MISRAWQRWRPSVLDYFLLADNARTNCAQGASVVTDLINIHEVSRLMRSPENGKRPACSLRSACSELSPGRSPAMVSAGEDKLQIGFKPDLLTYGDADFLGQVIAHALKVPGRTGGLNVPSGVGGAARKYVLAGRWCPTRRSKRTRRTGRTLFQAPHRTSGRRRRTQHVKSIPGPTRRGRELRYVHGREFAAG